MAVKKQILAFDFEEDRIIANKYRVLRQLGAGWEGEVYKVEEISTGIIRAAKFFLPKRNLKNKSSNFIAKKLHKLRHCSVLIQYITQESIYFKGQKITFLISDYVEGQTLKSFVDKERGKRLNSFQAVLLLHTVVKGLEEVHSLKEYHGDLHSENVMVERYGIGFEVKLLDLFNWGSSKPQDLKDDILDAVRLLYDILGGAKQYPQLSPEIKDIICGLKKNLILKKFKNMSQLRLHLENIKWSL